jgi:hypothetical protein
VAFIAMSSSNSPPPFDDLTNTVSESVLVSTFAGIDTTSSTSGDILHTWGLSHPHKGVHSIDDLSVIGAGPLGSDSDDDEWGDVDDEEFSLYYDPFNAVVGDDNLGVSLWNPDIDNVTIDTVSANDVRLSADVLSLSSRLARRTCEFNLGGGLRNLFDPRPDQASTRDPDDHVVFAPQPPDVVARETAAVLHMLTVANLWLTTVDVDSLRSADRLEMARLVGDSYQSVYHRFPPASHAPGCSFASSSAPLQRRVLLGIVTCLMLCLPGLPHRPGNRAPVRSVVLTSAAALFLITLSGGAAYCRSLPHLLHALLATGGALLSYRYGTDMTGLVCLSCGR